MMFSIDKKLTGVTVLTAVALGVCLSQPARANDPLNYIQDFFGGVNNDLNFNEARRMSALDDDRAEVDSRIEAAVAARRITPMEGAELRTQLRNNRVAQLQLARDGRFSFSDNAQVSRSLTSISASLQNTIASNVATIKPSSMFPPRGFVNRKQVDDLLNQLSLRIHTGRKNGNLTRTEFENLRSQLAAIEARKQEMISPRGMLSFSENQRLLSRLNRVQDQIRIEMHDSQVAGRNYPWY